MDEVVNEDLVGGSNPASKPKAGALRFCPFNNDLLYPKEDKANRKLKYACRTYDYEEDADSYCVYRNEIAHSSSEKTTVLLDVRADPTLPRTREVRCPKCNFAEAVFFSSSTTEGMTLFFQCVSCGNRWRDYV
mmetsp:Transcript_9408/g.34520  ORF Transcript_9408/g.34520 Transcript_9408/m.34520 type:complete len:133 (+) Transcript_9408:122-520(+)